MHSFMAWIGKLIGTVIAGPGVVVLGDPALDGDPATKQWDRLFIRRRQAYAGWPTARCRASERVQRRTDHG